MSTQTCLIDTYDRRPPGAARARRRDKPVDPCRDCGAHREPGTFPWKSQYCTECFEERGGHLPPIPSKVSTAPLAEYLERLIRREEALEPYSRFKPDNTKGRKGTSNPDRLLTVYRFDTRRVGICQRAGTSPKSLQEWREGRRTMVPWNTADRVLQNLGLFWWEVWTPENTSADEYAALERALGR
jgi:hypothetical protein